VLQLLMQVSHTWTRLEVLLLRNQWNKVDAYTSPPKAIRTSEGTLIYSASE
jgi:hypothetical protein